MLIFFVVAALLITFFGSSVFVGAPYLPAHKKAIDQAVKNLNSSKDGRVLDLGCGDGKFLVAAAKEGHRCTGYEFNLILFLITKIRLLKFKNAEVKLGNFWVKDFPKDTEVVYVFLLDKYMPKLNLKMEDESKRLNKNLSLISYIFEVPGKEVEKRVGGLRFYSYKKS